MTTSFKHWIWFWLNIKIFEVIISKDPIKVQYNSLDRRKHLLADQVPAKVMHCKPWVKLKNVQ